VDEYRLTAHYFLTPEGRPLFELYQAMTGSISQAEKTVMRAAMRAGTIRWALDKARIWPELIAD
jgi:hypothetical protein